MFNKLEYKKQYYLKNKNNEEFLLRKREVAKRSRKKNALKIAQAKHKYYENNKDKLIKESVIRRRNNSEYSKQYRLSHKEQSKAYKLKNNFGITVEEYNRILAAQDYVCAVCNNPEKRIDSRSGKISALAVDHNHKTGKNRELLCHACNIAIGYLKDDPLIAEKLAAYLNKHKEDIDHAH